MYQETLIFTDAADAARQEISSHGGHVAFDFGSGILVARLPESVDPASLRTARLEAPAPLDESAQLLVDAWTRSRDVGDRDDEPLLPRPSHTCGRSRETPAPSAELLAGSKRLRGKIAVVLVVVAGPGSLSVPAADVTDAISETMAGFSFLQSLNPVAEVQFLLANDMLTPPVPFLVSVQTEPCKVQKCVSDDDCEQFLYDAMGMLGLNKSRVGVNELASRAFRQTGSDAAYVVVITSYRVCNFAYAEDVGGSFLVINYRAPEVGINGIHRWVAHESCHIFLASDEYKASDHPCEMPFGDKKVLAVPNFNSDKCAWSHVTCRMGNFAPADMCEYTRWQVGWNNIEMPRQVVGLVGGRGGGGSPFSLTFAKGAQIVSVQMSSGSYVDSLIVEADVPRVGRVRLSTGGPGGSLSPVLTLASGERIVEVSGECEDYIHSLTFRTSAGQVLSAGGPGPMSFKYDVPDEHQLSGFTGRSGIYLDAIGLILDPTGGVVISKTDRMSGPSGGWGGDTFCIRPPTDSFRVAKILIRHGTYVDAIGLVYDVSGKIVDDGMAGGGGGVSSEIVLDPDEFIVGIAGRYGNYVDSLIVQTNKNPPMTRPTGFSRRFGGDGGVVRFEHSYSLAEEVVGFFGRAGTYIDALGCIFRRRP